MVHVEILVDLFQFFFLEHTCSVPSEIIHTRGCLYHSLTYSEYHLTIRRRHATITECKVFAKIRVLDVFTSARIVLRFLTFTFVMSISNRRALIVLNVYFFATI